MIWYNSLYYASNGSVFLVCAGGGGIYGGVDDDRDGAGAGPECSNGNQYTNPFSI